MAGKKKNTSAQQSQQATKSRQFAIDPLTGKTIQVGGDTDVADKRSKGKRPGSDRSGSVSDVFCVLKT